MSSSLMGLLNVVARLNPDIIKWIDDARAIRKYGLGHKIKWIVCSGWNGADVERILLRYGIPAYWRDYGIGTDERGLHVPKKQAVWADWLLRRAGCPVVSRQLSNVSDGAMPKAWSEENPDAAHPGVGFAGWFLRILGG